MLERNAFIAKCVDKNIKLPNTTKFGVSDQMTVQDLVNSNTETLQRIGSSIKKEADSIDPLFNPQEKGLTINGVPAEQWVSFIRLTLQKKLYEAELIKRKAEKALLRKEMEALETLPEKRKKLKARLSELEEVEE